jgi:hypothetical protein
LIVGRVTRNLDSAVSSTRTFLGDGNIGPCFVLDGGFVELIRTSLGVTGLSRREVS